MDAQRDAFPKLAQGWGLMVDAMGKAATDKTITAAAVEQHWTSALNRGRIAMIKAGCPDPPRELVPLITLTDRITANADAGRRVSVIEAAGLRNLLQDLVRTSRVRRQQEHLLDVPLTCEEVRSKVRASYSTRTLRTDAGRDAWGVLVVDNRSGRRLYAGVNGAMNASGPITGKPARMTWSRTARGVYAGPYRQSPHPLLGSGGERLHLTPSGRVRSLEVKVRVGFTPDRLDCPVSARKTGGSVTAAAAGDIACAPDNRAFNNGRGVPGRCRQKATAGLIDAMDPDAVFALGDLQYNAGELAKFNASYGPTWGRFKDITYPVLGNHEYGTPGAAGYFAYFGRRATPQDPDCTAHCRGYYSFDLGPWHIVALNTSCRELPAGDGCTARSTQNRWLLEDLRRANRTTACTAVIMHDPRWSSNHYASPELGALIDTMYGQGVELILSGSSHTYERFAPQDPNGRADRREGITQFVVGTGGSHTTGIRSTRRNSEVGTTKVFGVLGLTLADGRYNWSFRADPSTLFTDSGSRACH